MTFANLDSCHFSSLYILQTAPFLLMCCHTRINKYADLSESAVMNRTPLQLEDLVALTILAATHSNWWNRLFICVIFKTLARWDIEWMRWVCMCVWDRVLPREELDTQTTIHHGSKDLGSQTLNFPLKQRRGDVKGCIITTWNQWRTWN